jgi:Kef-type K+ transport system membrane component KefB
VAAAAKSEAVVALFAVKMATKFIGVFPTSFGFRVQRRQVWYTTMMMLTRLTFGSISDLFGYTHGFIDRGQYSVLVTVVVLTALVPTMIAQAFFYHRFHGLSWGRSRRGSEAEAEPIDVG